MPEIFLVKPPFSFFKKEMLSYKIYSYFEAMFPKSIFIFFTFIAGTFLQINGQGIYDQKPYGPYIMLFKLNAEQAKFAVQNPYKLDTAFLYTHKVGEISADSIIPLYKAQTNNLPIKAMNLENPYRLRGRNNQIWNLSLNGYFIETRVNSYNEVSYKLIENAVFHPSVIRIGYETYVFVEDSAGLSVTNAQVKLDTFSCIYDQSIGGYLIPSKNIYGTLEVSRDGHFTLNPVNGYENRGNYGKPPKDNYQYAKINHQGYLVVNKPVYKPGDTLFFKAYIVNKKSRPLKKTLIARLYQNNTGIASELTLKPNPKGAYHGWFVPGDSFKTDYELGLNLLTQNRHVVQYKNIRFENYELKDISLTSWVQNTLISPGSGNTIYVKTLNKAGLPLLDGSLNLKLQIQDIEYSAADSFQISTVKMHNFFSQSLQTDPSGITQFELPADLFPDIKGNFNAIISLTTAENEIQTQYLSFQYETTRDKQVSKIENDTLYVTRLYNMLPVERQMRLKIYSRYDLISDSIFTTPLKLYLPPNVYMVSIFKGDTLTSSLFRAGSMPEIKGKRTHDSIYISFHSKLDVPVFYRIYRNNILVKSGNDTVLNYSVKDNSKHSYHLQYGVLAGKVSDPVFYSQSFHLAEKELNVQIIQPQVIYPGQEVAVEIKVKNAFGKPVNKVNLTAWAVNMQLDGIEKPLLPFMGKQKSQKQLPIFHFQVGHFEYSHTSVLRNWQIAAFKLYDNQAFHVIYPKGGFEIIRDTTPDHSTQLVFYNHSSGIYSPVRYAKMNDTLVYYDLNNTNPEVIKTRAGKYKLTVRLAGRIYTLPEIEIKKGLKNFVAFNQDSLDLYDLGDTLSPNRFTTEEFNEIINHTILLRFDYLLSDTMIIDINGQTIKGIRPYTHSSQLPQIYTSIPRFNTTSKSMEYMQTQQFFAFGPVHENDKIGIIWKNHHAHEIQFMSNLTYSMTAKEYTQQPRDEVGEGHKYFVKHTYTNHNFNEFWWNPYAPKDVMESQPNQNAQFYQQPLPEYNYQNYEPDYYGQHIPGTLKVFLPEGFYAKKVWLFNKQDSTLSSLQNQPYNMSIPEVGLNYTLNNAHSRNGKYNKFTLVLQHNDTSWLIKDFEIDSSVLLLYKFKARDFKPLPFKQYLWFDRMAKILGRQPLVRFEDTPTVNKDLRMLKLPSQNLRTVLECTVNGPDIKYVVKDAFVVLERNGYFVRGAKTNFDGRFIMDSLEPGEYMLKIKAQDYHYWISYNLKLEKGKLHLLYISMKPFSRFTYTQPIDYDYGDAAEMNDVFYSASPSSSNADYGMVTIQSGRSKKLQFNAESKFKRTSEISVRGVRADGNATYIDGQSVYDKLESEDDNPFQGFIRSNYTILDEKSADISLADTVMLNNMALNNSANKIREKFQDYAYWIPNLTTNKKGYATYSVQFPDNITTWQTWVPAMDGKRHTGVGELQVKAYKPVSSSLALPNYLTEGDWLYAFGKINNYTGSDLKGRYSLLKDGIGIQDTVTVKSSYKDSLLIHAGAAGSRILLQNGFEMSNGYKDIQKRELWVIPASVTTGKSEFKLIENDTTLLFASYPGDNENILTVYNQQFAMILGLLNDQTAKIYPDNQSLADQLNALLIEKYIDEKLGLKFNKEEEVKDLIKKLRNAQMYDGTFGWFRKGQRENHLTTYAAEVLYKANNMGYNNNAWLNVAKYYEKQLPDLYENSMLHALYSLKKMDRKTDYENYIKRIDPKKLNQTEQIKYQLLLTYLGKTASVKVAADNLHPSPLGNLSLGAESNIHYINHPYFDASYRTYLAWELLYLNESEVSARKLMASWLGSEAAPSLRNKTLSAEMLVKEAEKASKKGIEKAVVSMNGSVISPDKMPLSVSIKKDSSITLVHSGAPVYIHHKRTFKSYNPVSDTNYYRISYSLDSLSSLQTGINTSLTVQVFAKSQQTNVVLEIPIPAGCVVTHKIQNEHWFEAQREYDYDRVYVYLDQLPFGVHNFKLNLLPRFAGKFNVPPARVSLMHYPESAAYTSKNFVIIK